MKGADFKISVDRSRRRKQLGSDGDKGSKARESE